jgi:hypothetical protein
MDDDFFKYFMAVILTISLIHISFAATSIDTHVKKISKNLESCAGK